MAENLPGWRDVMRPIDAVINGESDLAQVVKGKSEFSEYQDATEFFARTYMTSGLKRLLTEAINRLVKGNGEPVIEVKTAFGGGKTHSMMALYHLFNRKYDPNTVDEQVQSLMVETQTRPLPDDIRTATAVGTDINTLRSTEIGGREVHTLMGGICLQLALAAERIELFDRLIKRNDEHGVSTGVSDLREFLDGCGRCLILLDELALYGVKLFGSANRVPYDQFIAFLQELTEAVQTSRYSMLVVTLPQSDTELGKSEGGREVLQTIEHRFGRLQSIWTPVGAQESFEIVRRRLFNPIYSEKSRDKVCKAFSEMYGSKKIFPSEAKSKQYAERLRACYPIHPQMFDLLYGKWATIENFQKTRGVLRLMAEVIHALCQRIDQSPMIMAGTLPLDSARVQNELKNTLPDNWLTIIDMDIDGENSKAAALDRTKNRKESDIARRLTRTIFLGSAPTARGQNVRGLDEREVMLGAFMPGDNVGEFKDKLVALKDNLTYLYVAKNRYWFDGHPTLRKLAADFEAEIGDVDFDIIDLLEKSFGTNGKFYKTHATARAEAIADNGFGVQLVILPPQYPFERRDGKKCAAIAAAEGILNELRYKNMVLFLAGDGSALESLKKLIRSRKAWKKILDEIDKHNLDQKQLEDVNSTLDDLEQKIKAQISATYIHALVPTESDIKQIDWQEKTLQGKALNNVEEAHDYWCKNDVLIRELSSRLLAATLDEYFFKEKPHVYVDELWNFFAQYVYAPRLYNQSVLLQAIRAGVRVGYFGLADEYNDETDGYEHLIIGEPPDIQANDQLLVSAAEASARLEGSEIVADDTTSEQEAEPEEGEPPSMPTLPKSFRLLVEPNSDQLSTVAKKLQEDIVDVLKQMPGARISIAVSIDCRAEDGIDEETQEALNFNCGQSKFGKASFGD